MKNKKFKCILSGIVLICMIVFNVGNCISTNSKSSVALIDTISINTCYAESDGESDDSAQEITPTSGGNFIFEIITSMLFSD